MLFSERKVMCWTLRSCTDKSNPALPSSQQYPRARCASTFSLFTGPVLAASWQTSHTICSTTKKNLGLNRQSEDILRSQEIKHHLEKKVLEALLLHSVGTAPYPVPKQAYTAFTNSAPAHTDILKQQQRGCWSSSSAQSVADLHCENLQGS